MERTEFIYSRPKRKYRKRSITAFLFALAILFCVYIASLNSAPKHFPVNETVVIPSGATVSEVADLFDEQSLVKSSFYFYTLLQNNFTDAFIQAGRYQFPQALTSAELADAITKGLYVIPTEVVTFPEGFRIADMHTYLPEAYAETDLESLTELEGYLFPDTYYVGDKDGIEDIVRRMQETFTAKLAPLRERIESSPYTFEEVIILASILEREANDETSMRTVAGVLENRLDIGMALQVDATLEYILGRGSHDLTVDDLKLDSPYNTYVYTGLPPTPIANPGLDAIRAVLDPISSDYLYYLTGRDGNFYYAETFEEHKRNRARYLD